MGQVQVFAKAEAAFVFILQRNQHDPALLRRIRTAYYDIIFELRLRHPSIWLIPSDLDSRCFAIYEPPLRAHFRPIHDGKIGIVNFDEIGLPSP